MQLSNYIDTIIRVRSCLESQEQEYLFTLLDSLEEFYRLRRESRSEQIFWNQFWHTWDFPKLRDARQLAFEDMAADKYFTHVRENISIYRNFERAVVFDHYRCRLQILLDLSSDVADLYQEIFYNLQRQVQQFFENNDLPPINAKRLMPEIPKSIVTSKEIEITQSVKNEIAVAVAANKEENRKQKRKRLKHKRKEQRPKEAKEKMTKNTVTHRL